MKRMYKFMTMVLLLIFVASSFPMDVYAATRTAVITYNANGGINAPNAHSVQLDSEGVARFTLSTHVPTRQGYNFVGWRLFNDIAFDIDRPGQNIAFGTGNPNESVQFTYFAQWERIAEAAPAERYLNMTRAELAREILNRIDDPNRSIIITAARPNGSRVGDRRSARENLEDTANGLMATTRPGRDNAHLNTHLLRAILLIDDWDYVSTFRINFIAGATHDNNNPRNSHYRGTAIDIAQLNSRIATRQTQGDVANYLRGLGFDVRSEFATAGIWHVQVEGWTNPGTAPAVPAAPTGLTGTRLTANTATISWNEVAGATSYEVQFFSRDRNEWRTDPDYRVNTATSYITTGLLRFDYYDFRVRARNSAGVSEWTQFRYMHNQ